MTLPIVIIHINSLLYGWGHLLTPFVILISKSASFLVMSIKAYFCEVDCIIGVGFIIIFGGANKSALRCLKCVASIICLAPR